MLPIASINSVFVDHDLAYDLFRPALILQEIIEKKDQLGITHIPENASLLTMFNSLLNSDTESIKTEAMAIAKKYGNRLAKVLSTLIKPSELSKINRLNWDDTHWLFWESIRHIYMVGGLTSPILTNIFYQQIVHQFKQEDIQNVQVSFIEGSQNLGTSGMATLIQDGDYLLFDFGQTSIKRAHHLKRDSKTIIETYLEPVESKFLFYKTSNKEEIIETAKQLDDYIIQVILETINEVDFQGENIYLSIANYVSKGVLYAARGGYGKLAYLADNYQSHLQVKLHNALYRKVDIRMFHDTSAMALLFKDEPNTAVISLGTAFGVAFPE